MFWGVAIVSFCYINNITVKVLEFLLLCTIIFWNFSKYFLLYFLNDDAVKILWNHLRRFRKKFVFVTKFNIKKKKNFDSVNIRLRCYFQRSDLYLWCVQTPCWVLNCKYLYQVCSTILYILYILTWLLHCSTIQWFVVR